MICHADVTGDFRVDPFVYAGKFSEWPETVSGGVSLIAYLIHITSLGPADGQQTRRCGIIEASRHKAWRPWR